MPSLLSKVSSAAAACARRVSRATRRLPRTARRLLQRTRRPRRDFRQLVPTDDDHQQEASDGDAGEEEGGGEEEEGGLWRRTVLMGERCKPLDFPGAIHYDSSGRLLPAAPSPRSSGKAAGALLCRSACDVDEAATARSKARLAKAKHV
jgi:hypothetical protein